MKVIPFNKGLDKLYCGVVVDNLVDLNLPAINYRSPAPIPTSDTAIFNTGASDLYLSTDAPHSDNNPSALHFILGTVTGHI